MLSQGSQKSFWLYKFSNNYVSIWCQKKIYTAPFLDSQELHSWNTLKANVFIFLYISVRKCLLQRRSKILYGWRLVVGRLNNFLKAAHCFCLVKCFIIFYFNWNFGNSTIFQYFDTFIYSIKTLKDSRQFALPGEDCG